MSNPAIHALEAARAAAAVALREAEAAAKARRAELRSYEDALATLRGTPRQVETRDPISGGSTLSLKDAVIQAVESADGPLRAQQVMDAIVAAGRPTTMNSLLSTLSRVTRDGDIKSPSRGLWCKLAASINDSSGNDEEIEEILGDIDPAG